MIRRTFSSLILFLAVQFLSAQIPAGYYSATKGSQGRSLKTALHQVIKDHTVCSYSSLLDHFRQTDRRPDGKVWDMYSCTTNYSFGGKSSRYSGEGAGYNREHSFPKSWFGGKVPPMYTDLFHLYPTDGYINNRRWHYAFGENDGEIYQSDEGWSKLGKSTIPGYSEVVFEPNDEYKGDFARSYFYMATCYEDLIAGWKTLNGKTDGEKVPMLNQTSYPAFEEWALKMLLRWAKEDPVSQKEIDRNNAVYRIQHNRNPYIDFPGLEQYVWGSMTSTAFDPDNYDGTINPGPNPNPDPQPIYIEAPVFNPKSGVVSAGTEVTLSTSTPQAYIYYKVNNGQEESGLSPVKLSIQENTSISAYARLNDNVSETVSATYMLKGDVPSSQQVYRLVSSASELQAGQHLILAAPSVEMAMADQARDIRNHVSVTITDALINTEVNADNKPFAFLLGGQAGHWTFFDEVDDIYLALTTDNNKLNSATDGNGEEAQWDISIDATGTALIKNCARSNRWIQYNASAPRFACYKSSQTPISIYALLTNTGITELGKQTVGEVKVYDLNGKLLRQTTTVEQALKRLPQGLYIVNGEKILIR